MFVEHFFPAQFDKFSSRSNYHNLILKKYDNVIEFNIVLLTVLIIYLNCQ